MKKTSIIIPCYNVENFIDDCMNSVLSQTIGLEHMEIILVDDKSTDGTVEKLRLYESKYPEQIILVLSDKNGRQGTARNIGLSYASGDYICFVDSDDWIRKDMLECLVHIIEESGADVVQFRYLSKEKYTVKEQPLDSLTYQVFDYSQVENRRQNILQSDIMNESCWSKFYRKSLIQNAGVSFAEGVSYEEPLFTYPLKFFVNRVAVTETPFYYYRYNENGTVLSYMSKPSTIVEHLLVQRQTFDFVRKRDFFDEFQKEIELYFIHSFYVEPFYFLTYRGTYLPVVLFRYMCKEMKMLIPNYAENKYLDDSSMKEEKKILDLVCELANKDDVIAQERICEIQEELRKTL